MIFSLITIVVNGISPSHIPQKAKGKAAGKTPEAPKVKNQKQQKQQQIINDITPVTSESNIPNLSSFDWTSHSCSLLPELSSIGPIRGTAGVDHLNMAIARANHQPQHQGPNHHLNLTVINSIIYLDPIDAIMHARIACIDPKVQPFFAVSLHGNIRGSAHFKPVINSQVRDSYMELSMIKLVILRSFSSFALYFIVFGSISLSLFVPLFKLFKKYKLFIY